MTAQTSMYFRQELSSLLFGDAPLENSGSALLVFSFVNFVGFRTPNYATGLILVIRKLLPIKVGQERFSPSSNNGHDLMRRRCSAAGGVTRSVLDSLLSPCHTMDGLKSLSMKVLGGTGSRLAPMRARMSAPWFLSRVT